MTQKPSNPDILCKIVNDFRHGFVPVKEETISFAIEELCNIFDTPAINPKEVIDILIKIKIETDANEILNFTYTQLRLELKRFLENLPKTTIADKQDAEDNYIADFIEEQIKRQGLLDE